MSDDKKDLNKPIVLPDYISEIFEKLDTMDVELDEDPLEFGPSRLNSKIKKCRDYLSSVERLSLRASRKLLEIKETHRAAHKLYQIKEDKMMNTDPDVRAGRNIDDRRAIARLKLPEDVAELIWLEQGKEDMQTVLDALKYKQNGLKNIQSQIKEQRNLCNEDLALGRTWRNKQLKDPGLRPGTGKAVITSAVESETDSILHDIESVELDLPDLEEEGGDTDFPKLETPDREFSEPLDDDSKLVDPTTIRTPKGFINNCSLSFGEEEKLCQICKGKCPDRKKFGETITETEEEGKGESPSEGSPELEPATDVPEPTDTTSELDINAFLTSTDEEPEETEDADDADVDVDSLLDLLEDD